MITVEKMNSELTTRVIRNQKISSCSFFFSSRRRHTRCGRDWSSDVCSSDLHGLEHAMLADRLLQRLQPFQVEDLARLIGVPVDAVHRDLLHPIRGSPNTFVPLPTLQQVAQPGHAPASSTPFQHPVFRSSTITFLPTWSSPARPACCRRLRAGVVSAPPAGAGTREATDGASSAGPAGALRSPREGRTLPRVPPRHPAPPGLSPPPGARRQPPVLS